MADIIHMSSYNDLSNDNGYQFEFVCGHCNAAYRSTFKRSVVGTVAGVLGTAGNIFGGVFGTASTIGEKVKSFSSQKAHDDALQKAQDEVVLPNLIQCPQCQKWVCKAKCFDTAKNLCKSCLGEPTNSSPVADTASSAQTIKDATKSMGLDKFGVDIDKILNQTTPPCPSCKTPLAPGSKFCPNCGSKIN